MRTGITVGTRQMKTMSPVTSSPSVSGSFDWFISTANRVSCTCTCNGRQTDRHHTTGSEGMIALLQLNLTDFRQIAGSIRIEHWQESRRVCLHAFSNSRMDEWILVTVYRTVENCEQNRPSFGGEVKPPVPCHRFAACKRSLEFFFYLHCAFSI
jgi:hypothetical protein